MKKGLVSHKNLSTFLENLFLKAGVDHSIATQVTDGLVQTSLRGTDSHGIRLAPHYLRAIRVGRIKKKPHMMLKKTGASSAILNADHAFGICSGLLAMEQAMKLAKKTGIAAVAVKNSTHFAAAAIYSMKAAENDMIGISFTHTDALVYPFGGGKAYLGTNPICFAAPCFGEDPFVLDMATSVVPWNKILLYKTLEKALAPGWAADSNGNQTLDPQKATGLLPIGGYKGYGFGLMIEILCSLLTNMAFGPHINAMYPLKSKKRKLGHFFIAIDITKFVRLTTFKKRLAMLLSELRSVPPAEGFDKMRVPGDPEKENYEKRKKYGIPMTQAEKEDFLKISKELGMQEFYDRYMQ